MRGSKKKIQIKPKINILKFPIISRKTKITQQMLGNFYSVHNGKNYVIVLATTPRLNTTFGSYSITKKSCLHKKKDRKKKNN